MDLLSVRHEHSIGDPETERARLSIMRLVHSQFSKADGYNFIDVFSKIKGTMKLSFALRRKSYYVNIETGKSQ